MLKDFQTDERVKGKPDIMPSKVEKEETNMKQTPFQVIIQDEDEDEFVECYPFSHANSKDVRTVTTIL